MTTTQLPLPTEPPTQLLTTATTRVRDHPTYAAAQQAVDHLSDHGFPVQPAVAAVHSTGFRLNALLHQARGIGAMRALPITALQRLVGRFNSVAVVTGLPLKDPSGRLQPADPYSSASTTIARRATF